MKLRHRRVIQKITNTVESVIAALAAGITFIVLSFLLIFMNPTTERYMQLIVAAVKRNVSNSINH